MRQRNAAHRARQAALWHAAGSDLDRLAVAFDWFRSSAALLARRRPPAGIPQSAHEATAARLLAEMATTLKTAAEALDRGDHDARRVTHGDSR